MDIEIGKDTDNRSRIKWKIERDPKNRMAHRNRSREKNGRQKEIQRTEWKIEIDQEQNGRQKEI